MLFNSLIIINYFLPEVLIFKWRRERKQEAKNNKFKHEELKVSKFDFVKENSKKLGERINQDVDFKF